jgi:hypothetical protein
MPPPGRRSLERPVQCPAVTADIQRPVRALSLALAAAALIAGCGGSTTPSKRQSHALGPVGKTAGCHVQGSLPDRACTPGAVFSGAAKSQVCARGYTKRVRHVPNAVRKRVYSSYGIAHHLPGQYELDRLVALGLGGSEVQANLWPLAAAPPPGSHQKDALENYLHAQVCHHGLNLVTAQQELAGDWLAAYKRVGQAALKRYAPTRGKSAESVVSAGADCGGAGLNQCCDRAMQAHCYGWLPVAGMSQ